MWEHAFPEPIESIETATDITALEAYIAAAQTAGEERATAWRDATASPDDDDLDEAEAFHASIAAVQARIDQLRADEVARKARIDKLGYRKPEAPPPAPTPVITEPTPDPDPEPNPRGEFGIYPEIVVTAQLPSFSEGAVVTTLAEEGRALIERARRVGRSKTGEKFGVLQIRNYIPEEMHLPADGMAMFGMLQNDRFGEDGLVAGFCAPPTVDYSFCGGSSDLRPVLNSRRRYQAPRGRVTKMVTPLFSDVGTASGQVDDTGINQWTNDDDDADPFVEKLCSVLNCVGTEDFELYSTYLCVTIKNFLALADPEWVAFNLNQLHALWARFAEKLLLDQIWARAGGAITTTATYGSWATVLSRLNELVNNYTENERYATAPGLEMFAPRWLKAALKSDAIRMGKRLTDGDIASGLADIGIGRAVWTMDNAATIGDYAIQDKDDTLNDFPANASLVVSRSDNLRLMDFGTIDLGITTEQEYRDTTTNVRNEYQIFVESFEGIIDMGCPVWRFDIPVCNSGTIAPVSDYDPICPNIG